MWPRVMHQDLYSLLSPHSSSNQRCSVMMMERHSINGDACLLKA
jgi:hypothetical protein